MDNIVFKSLSDFDFANLVNVSRRIKISERSQKGISEKLSSFESEKSSVNVDGNQKSSVVNTDVHEQSKPVVDDVDKKESNPILDGIELKNVAMLLEVSWNVLGKRAIRLTPKMYEHVVTNTVVANIEEMADVVGLESASTVEEVNESVPEVSTDVEVSNVDSSEVQEKVNDAFVFTPVEIPIPPYFSAADLQKSVSVKKAAMAPAKMKKFSDTAETDLPRFTNNDLFSSEEKQETGVEVKDSVEEKVVNKNVSRDMVVVAPERKEAVDRFVVVDSVDDKNFDDVNAVDVTTSFETPKVDDEDIVSILAEIRKLEEQKSQSMKNMKEAKEKYEESVENLHRSEKEVADAQKSRADALARVEEIRTTLKAGIEEDNKSVLDFKQRTENNYKEIDKNTEKVEKTNAGTQELLTGMPVVA